LKSLHFKIHVLFQIITGSSRFVDVLMTKIWLGTNNTLELSMEYEEALITYYIHG